MTVMRYAFINQIERLMIIVLRAEAFVPMASVIMRLPAEIGDYTDCIASP